MEQRERFRVPEGVPNMEELVPVALTPEDLATLRKAHQVANRFWYSRVNAADKGVARLRRRKTKVAPENHPAIDAEIDRLLKLEDDMLADGESLFLLVGYLVGRGISS